MSDRPLICAVDGGGSGCRVALAEACGPVLARAEGGPANITSDPGAAIGNLLDAVERAALELGPRAPRLAELTAHLGLAGVLGPEHAASIAARLPFAHVSVTNDQVTALHGALGARDGALLAAGTGSFVGLRRGGETRFLGGWGLRLGDQGSGAWLGRELLSHVLMVEDGARPDSPLARTVLARFDARPERIVEFARGAEPSDYARLAPEIVAAAEAGDPVGRSLMARGAAYFEELLAVVDLRRAEVICLSGGLGPHYAPYLSDRTRSRLDAPKGDALAGALNLAQRLAEDMT